MDILKPILNLSPVGFLVFGIGVLMAIGALIFLQKDQPRTQENSPSQIEDWTLSPPKNITDEAGKSATIQLMVLSKDFSWVLESHTRVERNGQIIEDFKTKHLQTPGIAGAMLKYPEIIAVGAASSEGASHDPERERERAQRRADELQLWIKESVSATTPLYSLSLGYFIGDTKTVDSTSQRKIVIIGVKEKTPGINLNNALRKALGSMETFPFKPKDYSEFEIKTER